MEVAWWGLGMHSYAIIASAVSLPAVSTARPLDAILDAFLSLPRPMPYTDPIVLGLLLLSLLGSLVYQWRRGLRGGRLAVVTFAMFYGLAVISALGMHSLDVLYGLTRGLKSFVTGKAFAWDWHTYSLLLFGVLMVSLGVRCVRRALAMGRGDASARIEFLRLAGVMLLVVLPIVPIQPLFGVVGSGLSVIALLVVGLGARVTTRDASRIDLSGTVSVP